MNNNNLIINIEEEEDMFNKNIITDDEDEVFNTNYVDNSLALASNYSKSLNDIHMTHENILIRPNSLAIRTDDHVMYSHSNNVNNNKCFINDVSTSAAQNPFHEHVQYPCSNDMKYTFKYCRCTSRR